MKHQEATYWPQMPGICSFSSLHMIGPTRRRLLVCVDSADVRAAAAQPGASASVQAVWCLYTAAPGTAWHRLVTTQQQGGNHVF